MARRTSATSARSCWVTSRRRYLEWSGYEVTWVMNITDVDDRIIRDLAAKGGTLDELTAPHIARFPRGSGEAAHRPARRHRACDRAHSRDGRDGAHADRQRPRLRRRRRLDLLPHLDAGRRMAVLAQARSGAGTLHGARRGRRLRQGRRARLRRSGRARATASRHGTRKSARAGPAGTSSARR